MSHKHVFRRWAGGTNLMTQRSEDQYACECGAHMRVWNQQVEQHLVLPSTITIELLSEDAKAIVLDASES